MRLSRIILIAALAAGAFYAYQKLEIKGLSDLTFGWGAGNGSGVVPVKRTGKSIRIASFNLQTFGETKMQRPEVMDAVAKIIREFDVIALQEIRSRRNDVLPRIIEKVNAQGAHYDFVISPRLGRTKSKEQYAFIYDRASVELEPGYVYVVDDPEDAIHRPPFYGWFRVRGPEEDKAFTFTLVNLHTDPDEAEQEIRYIDDIMRRLRDDGREEDDVIFAGDFNASDVEIAKLNPMKNVIFAVTGTPTNTRKTKQYDNLIFHGQATSEFTGGAGVYDFMRQLNLSLEEALRVSDHLPVYAEFHVYEGGDFGQVAANQ